MKFFLFFYFFSFFYIFCNFTIFVIFTFFVIENGAPRSVFLSPPRKAPLSHFQGRTSKKLRAVGGILGVTACALSSDADGLAKTPGGKNKVKQSAPQIACHLTAALFSTPDVLLVTSALLKDRAIRGNACGSPKTARAVREAQRRLRPAF